MSESSQKPIAFKVWSQDRQAKKSVTASSLEELKIKGCEKLGINITGCMVVDESDDTEIDDDDVLFLLQKNGHVFVIMQQCTPSQKSVDVTESIKTQTLSNVAANIEKQPVEPVEVEQKIRKPPSVKQKPTGGLGLLKARIKFCDKTNENNVTTLTRELTTANVSDEEWVKLWKDPEFLELVNVSVNYTESRLHLNAFLSSHENLRTLIPASVIQDLGDKELEDVVQLPEYFETLEDVKRTFWDILGRGKIPLGFMRVLTNSCTQSESLEQSMIEAGALTYWSTTDKTFRQQWDLNTVKHSFDKVVNSLERSKSILRNRPIARHDRKKNVTNDLSKPAALTSVSPRHSKPSLKSNESEREPTSLTPQKQSFAGTDDGNISKTKLSLTVLVGENIRRISQSVYYTIHGIRPAPNLNPDVPEEFLLRFIPYLLQRVKMRGCSVLQPTRITALVQNTDDLTCSSKSPQSPFSSTNTTSESCPVSRLDCITCLLGLADDVVVSDLLTIMSQFPMTLPLIMRSISDNTYSMLAPIMRGLTVKWETSSGKIVEHALFCNSFRMVVTVRLGSNSIGKSTILNQLLSREYTFSSTSEPGSSYGKPLSLDGSVELLWLTQETCKDAFWSSTLKNIYDTNRNEIVLLANLHGDANDFPDIIRLLNQFCCRYLVFIMPDCTEYKWNEFVKSVGSSDNIVTMRVDPKDYKPRSNSDIQTSRLMVDDTMNKVRQMIHQSLQFNPAQVDAQALARSAVGSRVRVSQQMETQPSNALINFVKNYQCKKVKEIMKLQKYRYGDDLVKKDRLLKSDKELQSLVGLFVNVLLLPEKELQTALIHIERELSRLSNSESQDAREEVSKLRAELRRVVLTNAKNYQQIDELRKRVDRSMGQVDEMSLGLEHLFREMASVYEVELKNSKNVDVLKLPEKVARLFIEGQPVELLDGDVGDIPLVWFTSFCQHVSKQRPGLRVFVVSIIGLQSSGKSTLLNSLFACRFAVSVGRCSRGLFMRLLLLDNELAKNYKYDAILLIDTEGLGSPEKMNDPEAEKKDRLLATFAMGISNLTLINVMGENIIDMTEILQIAIVTMTRLEKADIAPDILMVQYLLTEKNADKTARGQDQFTQAIRNAMDFADRKGDAVGVRNAKCLRVLLERVQNETLLVQFHPYKDGATVNSPPSELYHEDVVQLYKKILESGRTSKTVIEFERWYSLVASYWECVTQEDFALRFKNIKEMHEFIERGNKIADVKQAIDAAFSFHERRLNEKMISRTTQLTAGDTREKERLFEGLMAEIRRDLSEVPGTCSNKQQACESCQKSNHAQSAFYEQIRDHPCEEETHKTIQTYIVKTREDTVTKLCRTFDAIAVQRGCSSNFDEVISGHLKACLKNQHEGNYTEHEIKIITNDIFELLKRAAKGMNTDQPVTKRFLEDFAREYDQYPGIAGELVQRRWTFDDVVQFDSASENAAIKLCKAVKKKIVGDKPGDRELQHLKVDIFGLPQKTINARNAECYDHGMIRDVKHNVMVTLEQFQESNKKISKHLNKMHAHIWAQQLLLDKVIELHNVWDRRTNPVLILEANRQRYEEIIKTRLEFGFSFQSEGKILAKHIIEAIKNMAVAEASKANINSILDLGWTTNSEKIRLEYLVELAEEVGSGNKERALRHFKDPKAEIEEWYKKKVDSFKSHANDNVFRQTYEKQYRSALHQVKKADNMFELVVAAESVISLGGVVEYRRSINLDVEHEESNFIVVRDSLFDTLKASESPPSTDKMKFTLPSEDRDVMGRLGCTERCFWCGSLCWGQRGHEDSADNTKLHHSSHQAMGLIGVNNRNTNELMASPCHCIQDETKVHWGDYCDTGMLWQQAKKEHFNKWLFDKHFNAKFDELMRWFFQELHVDIAAQRSLVKSPQDDLEKYQCVNLTLDPILSRIKAVLGTVG